MPMAVELEQRLDALRAEFARKYTSSLESLATNSVKSGDLPASARWWRKLVDHDPLNGRYARELISALAGAGETAGALQFALVHDALVRQETSAPPAPEVTQWIQRLRTSGADVPRGVTKAAPAFTGSVEERSAVDRRGSRLARIASPRYRVGALLEEGALTATYLAHTSDNDLPHELEMNVLQPRVAALVGADRFLESMQRASSLAEPHVLPTLDAAVAEEVLYFVTSRRPPSTLRDRLKRERALPIAEAIDIAWGIATALAHAHERGLVHGDLRPKHVGLAGGEAVVRGFGLVEALSEITDNSTRSTIVAIGSPAYLSPEQRLDNAPPSARGDVYALGCICYEMLTGERPVAPGRLKATPLRDLRETISEPLARFVHACMARLPADRPASSADAVRELASLQSVAT